MLQEPTQAMWAEWWSSPMATQWTASDVYGLTRLALMYDDLYRDGEVSDRITVEMRQLEAQFGLTPKGRKELHWVIGEPDEEKSARPRRTRESHLRAVDPAG